MESAPLRIVSAESGPKVRMVMVMASALPLMRRAASTACSSKGLMTIGRPGTGMTLLAASSTLKRLDAISGSGICFTQTMTRMSL